jgi:hypothetical protein
MPLYPHICDSCKTELDEYRPVRLASINPQCCGEPMRRIFTPCFVRPDIAEFFSPVDGTLIRGRVERNEYMKRNNLLCAAEKSQETPVLRNYTPTINRNEMLKAEQKILSGYRPNVGGSIDDGKVLTT